MREKLTMLVIVGTRTDVHSLRSQVGIRSESDCLLGQSDRSRQRAFQRAIDELCSLHYHYSEVPQSMAQKAILLFLPVKFNFCRKTSATKFLSVKTSSGRVVATSFPYLMVNRWIAGDIPIYLKFALKVTHPFRKHRFR